MIKQGSVTDNEAADMLTKVHRNPLDALLTSTIMRHGTENDMAALLEEMDPEELMVARDQKDYRIEELTFENVESMLDR